MNSISSFGNVDIKRNLDAAWLNQQSIANNIANINTPNFRAEHIEATALAGELDLAVSVSAPGQIATLPASPVAGIERVPVENLALDSEIAEMGKNNLFYQTLVEAVQRRDRMAKSVLER